MTTEEILESLCYYDKRNPDCTADEEDIADHKAQLLRLSKKLGYNKTCNCDNCFYGRTKLAEELLKVISTKNVTSYPPVTNKRSSLLYDIGIKHLSEEDKSNFNNFIKDSQDSQK